MGKVSLSAQDPAMPQGPLPVRHTQAPAHPEVADLQAVMRSIRGRLDDIVAEIPEASRALVPNALLNLAIEHILASEGTAVTAGILQRLATLIQAGEGPEGHGAFRLTGHDG